MSENTPQRVSRYLKFPNLLLALGFGLTALFGCGGGGSSSQSSSNGAGLQVTGTLSRGGIPLSGVAVTASPISANGASSDLAQPIPENFGWTNQGSSGSGALAGAGESEQGESDNENESAEKTASLSRVETDRSDSNGQFLLQFDANPGDISLGFLGNGVSSVNAIHGIPSQASGLLVRLEAAGNSEILQETSVVFLDSHGNEISSGGQSTPQPSPQPTARPSVQPTAQPSVEPTVRPTTQPSSQPTARPTAQPTAKPTIAPTVRPSATPTPVQTGNFDANGNTHLFGIPSGATGNVSRGANVWGGSCSGCHGSEKKNRNYSQIVGSLSIPAMRGISLSPQEIADVTAYLNRANK